MRGGSYLKSVPNQTPVRSVEPNPSAMSAYDWKLSDTEIAAGARRNTWGNAAAEVSAG